MCFYDVVGKQKFIKARAKWNVVERSAVVVVFLKAFGPKARIL